MTRPLLLAHSARTAAICVAIPGARYHLPKTLGYRLTVIGAAGDGAPNPPGLGGEGAATIAGQTDRAVLLLHDLVPSTAYRLEIEGCEALLFETDPCAGRVLATEYGVVADVDLSDLTGAAANAAALGRAVDAVPVGGTLILPAGVWTAFPLRLKSDMTLHLSEGAVLRTPELRTGWPILPARDRRGAMLGSWEGLPASCFQAGLDAVDAVNLTIEGPGIIDGSGSAGDWWSWPKDTREGARRPRGLHLIGCRNVRLLGFTIRNAPSWTIHPQGCEQLTAAGLHILAPHDSPNTDGFNPEFCRDVVIAGTRFSVGDDCIAIKAGKRGSGGEADHLAETRGVRIRHCLMERGHGGLVIGSEMSGGVFDVIIEDCEMFGTDRGLRIKTRRGRGGVVCGVIMRRVLLDGVATALSVNAHYHCDLDGHSHAVQSRLPQPFGLNTPMVGQIIIDDVEIRNLEHAAGVFLGLPEAPVRNVRISRLRILSWAADAQPRPPIMADHIRPMRHETILSEHAEVACDDPRLISAASISLLPTREAV